MVEDNTSAWQMGNRTLERINRILTECELARNVRNYPIWFDKIVSLHFELMPFLESDKTQKKQKISDLIQKIRKNISGYNAKISNNKKLEEDLLSVEGELRIALLRYNLLIPKLDDPRAAVFKV